MGTTSDKLTYLNGTKQALKESINNIGGSITDETTFRAYATELDNIYSNIPKTTGEGSNLSLTTLKGKLNIEAYKGDTEQDTYEGYNLLVYPYNYLNGNGTSLDKNIEGDLEVTGTTTTSGMAHFFLTNAVELKTNTTYTITRTIETLSGTATSATGQIELYIGNTWKKAVLFNNQTSATFTVDDNAVYRIIVKLGSLSETSKFKIGNFMIYEGTETKTFQKYYGGQASPNPTYPQDINVVTGQQEVVASNKNLSHIEAEGKFRANATGEFVINVAFNSYIASVKPNTTYISSAKDITTQYTYITNLCYFDKNMTYISGSAYNTANKEFTTPNNCYYVTIAVNTNAENVQIELGSTSTSYVEHQEQTKTLHLGDIELSKIGTYQDRIFETSGKNKFNPDVTGLFTSGCNVSESNGEITITATQNGDIYVGNVRASGNSYETTRGVKILVKPNTQYTISSTNSSVNKILITEYNSSDISLGFIQNTTISTQANTSYITIRYGLENATSGTSYKTRIMLNEGSTALPYEPYGSDKWYIEKNIGHKKASEIIENNIGLVAQGTSIYNTGVKSDRTLQVYSNVQTWKNTTDTEWNTLNGNYIGILYNVSQIYINKTASVRSEILTWLNSINFEMYYVLATPTYTEITNETLLNELNEIEKMMSYNGKTNISISGNLPMILNVSALKGE